MEVVKTEPTPRTLENVRQDYGQVCAQIGEINYKEDLFQKELRRMQEAKQGLMVKLSTLNDEASKLSPASVSPNVPDPTPDATPPTPAA